MSSGATHSHCASFCTRDTYGTQPGIMEQLRVQLAVTSAKHLGHEVQVNLCDSSGAVVTHNHTLFYTCSQKGKMGSTGCSGGRINGHGDVLRRATPALSTSNVAAACFGPQVPVEMNHNLSTDTTAVPIHSKGVMDDKKSVTGQFRQPTTTYARREQRQRATTTTANN